MSNIDKITDFALSKVNDLITGVEHTLPTITKYALQVTSLNNMVEIIQAGITLAVGLILSFLTYKYFSWLRSAWDKWDSYRDDGKFIGSTLFLIAMIVTSSFFDIVGLIGLTDIWKWIGIWHPDLYLVHEALVKALEAAQNK